MSRRDNAAERCLACKMMAPLCLCAELPRLMPRTRVRLLIHYREARKPTNTGQLATACLAHAQVVTLGLPAQPPPTLRFAADEAPVLLFPAQDAVPLTAVYQALRPDQHPVLIVPDGNWRQATKMRQRVAGLATVPCAVLPDTLATSYRLRHEPREGGLATLEAIAAALELLEGERGPTLASELRLVFRKMVTRTLWLRGQLPANEVEGGVPAAALTWLQRTHRPPA